MLGVGSSLGTSRPLGTLRHFTALLLAVILVGCNRLVSTNEGIPLASTNEGIPPASTNEGIRELAPDPSYRDVIANRLKTTFKDYSSYEAFEISSPRWVHSFQGWAWLVCVRFQAQGHKRAYALFIKGSDIIDTRYAVKTDECGTQGYALFEQMGGSGLDPLH
jgi:hypothetical protein